MNLVLETVEMKTYKKLNRIEIIPEGDFIKRESSSPSLKNQDINGKGQSNSFSARIKTGFGSIRRCFNSIYKG